MNKKKSTITAFVIILENITIGEADQPTKYM